MELSNRELWTTLHGFLGAGFILAFSGGLMGLWSLRPEVAAVKDIRQRLPFLFGGMWGMALLAWATAIIGTYVVFPWYRVGPPPGAADLTAYPSYLLLSDPDTDLFHKLGMETKENWGWIVPILVTAVAFVATYYGAQLAYNERMRRLVIALFVLSFALASIVGLFGVLASKAAPVQ